MKCAQCWKEIFTEKPVSWFNNQKVYACSQDCVDKLEFEKRRKRIQIIYINSAITNNGKPVYRDVTPLSSPRYYFKMYDDDNIHYFTGCCDREEEVIDLFDDYKEMYGVTRLDTQLQVRSLDGTSHPFRTIIG